MKVILEQDVKKLGKKGAVLDVSDGYAKNFLFPRKLAKPYTEGNVKALETEKKNQQTKEQRLLEQAKKHAEALSKHKILLKVKTGGEGRLFGSVTSQDIADAIKKQTGHDIQKRQVLLDEHIKHTGRYTVDVKLHPEIKAKVEFEVVEA